LHSDPIPNAKDRLRWLLYPGINLHARLRYSQLPLRFGEAKRGEVRRVLDAGCGNGMLSYQAYLKGNCVTAISIKRSEVASCRRQFNELQRIPYEQMSFNFANLYEVDYPARHFDEIICTEVLEHIERDGEVCRRFWKFLKPGGVLHLTSPNADHPHNLDSELDGHEAGGHVREGYTPKTFKALLEPIGFRIEEFAGLGGPMRQAFNRRIRQVQERAGPAAGLPLFFASLPVLPLDRLMRGAEPYALYARARKPG